ncbi:2-keto-4-pentenoate hydratase [Ureibacillus sp. FSL K6-8385]|uniref:2-keto-4-pentenoate hydratase n=1 Tax=Ureibacillus terrenus TaxID=118246 RepID=A0A540V1Z9_9BACL|nr:2-keto-4-pentenoate hydratase [Ureibacillus terrenus]MED3661055.1 2-keto-4-pentenoate hydratase [Ureibacillus terrenus]MED3763341.1 2-keto-4-pentenoate hydratase [Ureibacillus terrenus]TQE90756.1 2-keto-4-pentenoate hydratase [Ureibacillus terrenus]
MDIQLIAEQLLKAERTKQPIPPLTGAYKELNGQDAYAIQLALIQKKVREGARIKGLKIGLTSKAIQEMLNVYTPDYGFILDTMIYDENQPLPAHPFIQPKIEFEIAFVFKKKLQGPDVTVQDVIDATDYVVPSAEIIDSRIANWEIRFEDTVADNGSSAGAILGKKRTSLEDIEDISNIEMTVWKNGEILDQASSSAVLGNPLNAVVWLANEVGRYGISIEPGMFVLSGSLSKAVTFEQGDEFVADFGPLGDVKVNIMQKVVNR